MTHEFHSHGGRLPESREALNRIAAAIRWAAGEAGGFPPIGGTEVDALR